MGRNTMSNMTMDVAAVVNLHREGTTAAPSLISAWRAIENARAHGHSARLVLALDRSDEATEGLAKEWEDRGAHLVSCNEGDLGAARNAAVQEVDADWIAFLDADDLWSENWLTAAAEVASQLPRRPGPDVLHPAVNVIFGDHHSLLHHRASDDPSFSWARFRLHNAWTALSVARRSDLLELPYPRNVLVEGFGFEDWSWNMAVLDAGGRHHVVRDTCHFIRRVTAGSLLTSSAEALRSPYPVDDIATRPVLEQLSELTPTDPNLPPTHRHAEHHLSAVLLEQIRLAETIEPAVSQTVNGQGRPLALAQNFNTHVTAPQRALESVELAIHTQAPASLADALEGSAELARLSKPEQHRIVAEVLRSPDCGSLPRGDSPLVEATLQTYPQLNRSETSEG